MERLLLIGAIGCFLASFGATLYGLGAGNFRPGKINLIAICAGFIFQTVFLYLRGRQEGSCPLHGLFEVFVFQSWAFVLIYLMIGPAYRLSLMGAFTSPLVLFLLLLALATYSGGPVSRPIVKLSPWLELHASLSIVSYGAFGLACVAAVMYLLQEFQLKHHRASSLLYNLPPISDLAIANFRLLLMGFVILTISFFAGVMVRKPVNELKSGASLAIWAAYGCILILYRMRVIPPRRLAHLSVVVFICVLVTLPAIQHLSLRP